MAEYLGNDTMVALQKRVRARAAGVKNSPWVSSGARVMLYAEPSPDTWPQALAIALEDGFLCVPAIEPELSGEALLPEFPPGWQFHRWDAFMGRAEDVLPACDRVITLVGLPSDWTIEASTAPDEAEIDEVQTLCQLSGVSPNPAFAMTGELAPALTVMIRDGGGRLMASAYAGMFFHPQGRLGGTAFAGLVCVAETARGKGLGKLANALALHHSHGPLGWTSVTEFVAFDNVPSRAMIAACGLTNEGGYITDIFSSGSERLTR